MHRDSFLTSRISDLAMQAYTQHVYTCTRFLTPLEQNAVLSMQKELPVTVRMTGRADDSASSIRKIAVFGSEKEFGYEFDNPIRILHIRPKSEKFAEELSHRDYLGSLMGLGIERELTGDIVVRGKEAWIFVLETILPFLCDHLSQVRRTNVICEEVSGEIPELIPQFQSLQINTPSERLDVLLAAITGLNRESAKKLLKEEKVFINGLTASSAGHKLKPGDEIVIRGSGKYIYDGIASTTRKGRCNLTVRKYI